MTSSRALVAVPLAVVLTLAAACSTGPTRADDVPADEPAVATPAAQEDTDARVDADAESLAGSDLTEVEQTAAERAAVPADPGAASDPSATPADGVPSEDATHLGPVALVLPDRLGPWRSLATAPPDAPAGWDVLGAWLTATDDGVVVNVVQYAPAPGTADGGDPVEHVKALLTAFGAEHVRDVPWAGTLPARLQVLGTPTWTFVLLSLEDPHGGVVSVLAQGPADLLADGDLEHAVASAVHTGGVPD